MTSGHPKHRLDGPTTRSWGRPRTAALVVLAAMIVAAALIAVAVLSLVVGS